MQLSLPVPVSPEAATPAATAGSTIVVPGQLPAGFPLFSFDKFFPETKGTPKPAAKGEAMDAEKASAILAASFWMPTVTLPLAQAMPAAGPGGAAPVATPAPSIASVFFATPSSRAFVPLAAEATTANLAGKPVSGIISGKEILPASPDLGTIPMSQFAGETVGPATLIPGQLPATGGQPVRDPLPAVGTGELQPEKIAAITTLAQENSSETNPPDKKDFLNTGYATVTTPVAGIGISVAHVAAAMPVVPPNRSKSAPATGPAPVAPVSIETRPALNFAPDAPAPAATLREAMAAVVTAVTALDHHEALGQKTLDLQFHVGDERLAVRVELRDGTVHTTFRTDSADLRTALTQEWQSVVPPAAGRDIRLAEPVFNMSPAGAGESAFGSLGQGAPHERGQPAPEAFLSVLSPDFPESVAAEPVVTATSASGPTPLLHVFA